MTAPDIERVADELKLSGLGRSRAFPDIECVADAVKTAAQEYHAGPAWWGIEPIPLWKMQALAAYRVVVKDLGRHPDFAHNRLVMAVLRHIAARLEGECDG